MPTALKLCAKGVSSTTAKPCKPCATAYDSTGKKCLAACAKGVKSTTAKPCYTASSNTGAIVGGVIAGLVVVGLLAYFFMGKKDEEKSLLDDFKEL